MAFDKQVNAPLTLHETDYVRKSIENLQKNVIETGLLKQAFPGFINDNQRKIKL